MFFFSTCLPGPADGGENTCSRAIQMTRALFLDYDEKENMISFFSGRALMEKLSRARQIEDKYL